MKKFAVLFALVLALCVSFSAVAEQVDTYAGASLTKSFVEGEELAALAATLTVSGADIATTAQTLEEGYEKMYGLHVNVVSVNPDGCPGMSTIGFWRYVDNREGGADVAIKAGDWQYTRRGEGCDQVVFQLTDGQNARNLAKEGSRCTIVVKVEGATYLLHLNVTEVFAQEFTQEAYDAGEFAYGYSGADRQATSYYYVADVLSVEKSFSILF
ncbi:MAG: hypothetical protein IKV90_05355 [Clostridia bacterium]|nr:hypothetical protein [Clostridia bacterium]